MIKRQKEFNPYCEKCGTCGYVACDGVREFLKVHVKGKTDCPHEASVLFDIISMINQHLPEEMEAKPLNYGKAFGVSKRKVVKSTQT